MPTPQLYPYKLRVFFTASQRDRLRAASAQRGQSINDLIRHYVQRGLDQDGITAAAEPSSGQLTIDPEGDPE